MPEYAGICVNMPKSAQQLFLRVSIDDDNDDELFLWYG